MSEWKTIDSAPKDQTEILVWDGMFIWMARQNEFGYWSTDQEEGFYLAKNEFVGLTHWMPLPEPPK